MAVAMTPIRRLACGLLVVVLSSTAAISSARAGLIATDAAIAAHRQRVESLLEREEVRRQLLAHGVDPGEVRTRAAVLTDQEIVQLIRGGAPAGGADPLAVLFVIGIVFVYLWPFLALGWELAKDVSKMDKPFEEAY